MSDSWIIVSNAFFSNTKHNKLRITHLFVIKLKIIKQTIKVIWNKLDLIISDYFAIALLEDMFFSYCLKLL